ncbi:MAG: type IV secretion system DNA-binding domain-containing protein [Acidimicrobiales bacterium]
MAAPSPPSPLTQNWNHNTATTLLAVAAIGVLLVPGALVGALLAWVVWRVTRPPILVTWLLGALGAATAAAQASALSVAWPWQLLAASVGINQSAPSANAIAASLPVEALFGPLVLVVARHGVDHWWRTIQGQEWARARAVAAQKKALERGWPGPDGAKPPADDGGAPGVIRLGTLAEDGRPFDIAIGELGQHVFLPGASGTGKTTTIARLADGALANGYGVVIVDCKGSGLGGVARQLAHRLAVPFTRVDPRSPDSVGYDPCSGDAAQVANKIVGAFTFSGEAEIYKQVAMEVIPVLCRAMVAAGIRVTLDSIYESLSKGMMSRLGRKDGAEAYRVRLEELEDSGGVGHAGYAGLQRRLGALMEGTFGELFRKEPALSWADEFASPRVTYLSLSATAASEDVELFGRVITQDLKQVCDERMRAIERGEDVTPVLIVYDEFAALREATQIVDLLLLARQAKAPLVVATQYLPEEVPIRKPVLSAGLLIVHRLEAEDSELIASQFGTHTTPNLTAQVDYETGQSQKGSVRYVEEYDIHPNLLKSLPVGTAAVLAREPTQVTRADPPHDLTRHGRGNDGDDTGWEGAGR